MWECVLKFPISILASGVPGKCFQLPDVKPVSEKAAKEVAKEQFASAVNLGEGLCRGEGWADDEDWPKDKQRRTAKECYAACKQAVGCTAFDTSAAKGKTVQCYLYGHSEVSPASSFHGQCYRMSDVKMESGGIKVCHLI